MDGDIVNLRLNVEEILEDLDGNVMCVYGVYNDKLVKEDGKWKFFECYYNVIYCGFIELIGDKIGYKG